MNTHAHDTSMGIFSVIFILLFCFSVVIITLMKGSFKKALICLFLLFAFFIPSINKVEALIAGGPNPLLTKAIVKGGTAVVNKAESEVGRAVVKYAEENLAGLVSVLGNFIFVFPAQGFAALTSGFTYLAAEGFNLGLEFAINDVKDLVDSDAIKETWKIFRDLGHIGLIFILLYIALNTIIQASNFQTQKLLGRTIIVALLINFSYFFAALTIDISNSMAASIANTIEQETSENIGAWMLEKIATENMVDSFHKVFPTTTTVDQGSGGGSNEEEDKFPILLEIREIFKAWAGHTLLGLFNIALILVFVLMIIMIITRTIMLTLLVLTSPLGFMGSVLPTTEKLGKQWRENLFSNAFFLPVFLLFYLVCVRLINQSVVFEDKEGVQDADPNLKLGDAIIKLWEDTQEIVLQYIIIIGILLAGLGAAKKISEAGGGGLASFSSNINNRLGGRFLGNVAAGGALLGRNTVGRLGDVISNNKALRDSAATNFGSRLVLRGARGLGNAKFDGRNSDGFKGVASATGFGDVGKGRTGGFRDAQQAAIDSKKNFAAEALGKDDVHPFVNSFIKTQEKALKTAKRMPNSSRGDKAARKAAIEAAEDALEIGQKRKAKQEGARIEKYMKTLERKPSTKVSRAAAKDMSKVLKKAQKDFKTDLIKELKSSKKGKK